MPLARRQFVAVLAVASSLAGCSGTAGIADSAASIRGSAGRVRSAAERIIASADDLQGIEALAAAPPLHGGDARSPVEVLQSIESDGYLIIDEVDKVVGASEDINKDLTRVEDKEPWWSGMVKWAAGAVTFAAIAFVLWRSGVLAWLSAWLRLTSPKTRQRASLLRKVSDNRVDLSEVIAAERSDRSFNAEWKRQEKKHARPQA